MVSATLVVNQQWYTSIGTSVKIIVIASGRTVVIARGAIVVLASGRNSRGASGRTSSGTSRKTAGVLSGGLEYTSSGTPVLEAVLEQ